MTMKQKKALYAFGSPDREATVNRFCTLAQLAPDSVVKHFFLAIARELNALTADRFCRLEKSFAQGGVIYALDKSRLSIRLQAPYSEERRRKASESAKQTGFKSRAE